MDNAAQTEKAEDEAFQIAVRIDGAISSRGDANTVTDEDGNNSHGNGQGDGQRGPPLAHREALKQALAALWEEDISPGGGSTLRTEAGHSTDSSYGGLQASELSATVYGMETFAGIDYHSGCEGTAYAEDEGVRGFEYSAQDLEGILSELESDITRAQGDDRG